MTLTTPAHRRSLLLLLLAVMFGALFAVTGVGVPTPAYAEPNESGTEKLRKALDVATRAYLDAKYAMEKSQRENTALTTELAQLEVAHTKKVAAVGELAAAAYATGRLGAVSAMLGADSPDDFVDRIFAYGAVTANEDGTLRDMVRSKERIEAQKAAIAETLDEQRKQFAIMAARKKQAEDALKEAGYGKTGSGFGTLAKTAVPAPRNADGSWPKESCSVDDPTTGGCITPRTLHAYKQARAAGFTRYVYCWRSGSSGEHPKGRACDFAAQKDGFGGAATGDDRTYGNNLATYFVKNADRLGVMYVIWYRQIWVNGSGWRSYSGSGSPGAEHTNHVHNSMY